ncbi:MAG: hypothetical protein ACE37E_11100 [Hyphomicrobiales bacterium]
MFKIEYNYCYILFYTVLYNDTTLILHMTFDEHHILTPAQCRAARALLGIDQPMLSTLSDVASSTISAFENGKQQAAVKTTRKLRATLEQAGAAFTEGDGVRRRELDLIRVVTGDDANLRIHDDIYHTLKKHGGEVLCAGITELDESAGEQFTLLKNHIARLQDAGITERILLKNGDTNLVAPREWYRWIKADYFGATPVQIYGDKIALKDHANNQILLIEHPLFATTQRAAFEALWSIASPVDTGAIDNG